MDAKSEKITLFRFGAISSLVLEPLPRGELTRRAEEIAARHFDVPAFKRTPVSVDTLLDWAFRYRNGVEALAPQPRQDRGQSRTITQQLADLIERLKRENPHRTGTTLLRELALSSSQNEPAISASTLYRFLKQRGLSERQLLAPPGHKKFEAEYSNQIWQSDMLYGPYGLARRLSPHRSQFPGNHAPAALAARYRAHPPAEFKASGKRLDMGKCCVHFESPDNLPLEAIEKLISSISSEEWIEMYEQSRLKTKAGQARMAKPGASSTSDVAAKRVATKRRG